jgi:stromal membrane-associated protein
MASINPQINATLRSEPAEQLAANKVKLEALMKLDGNYVCADCPIQNPDWASINLGIFVCLRCSGIHRSLGVHISKVKSVALDDWNTNWVENMELWGNVRSNSEVWEVSVPSNRSQPAATDPAQKVEQWIRDKYQHKMFSEAAKVSALISPASPHHGLGVGATLKRLNKMFTADMVVKKRADHDMEDIEEAQVEFSGVLKKRGRKNKGWRERSFGISRGELAYYEKEPKTKGSSNASTGGWASSSGTVPPPPPGGTKLHGHVSHRQGTGPKIKGAVDLASCALLLPPAATGAHDVSKKGAGMAYYFVLLSEKPEHRMMHIAALTQHDHMQWIDRLQVAIKQARKRREAALAPPIVTEGMEGDAKKLTEGDDMPTEPSNKTTFRPCSLMHWVEERSTTMLASLCDGTSNSGAPLDKRSRRKRSRNITIGGSELSNPMNRKSSGSSVLALTKRLTMKLSGGSGRDKHNGSVSKDGEDDDDAADDFTASGSAVLPGRNGEERARARSFFGFGQDVQVQLDEAARLETHLVVTPSHPLGVSFSETKEGGMVVVTRSEVPGLEVGSLVLAMNGRPVGEMALRDWKKGDAKGVAAKRVSGASANAGGGGEEEQVRARRNSVDVVKQKLSAGGWTSHSGSKKNILVKSKSIDDGGLRRAASKGEMKVEQEDECYWPMKRFQFAWSEADSLLGVELVVVRPPALAAFATKRSRALHGE